MERERRHTTLVQHYRVKKAMSDRFVASTSQQQSSEIEGIRITESDPNAKFSSVWSSVQQRPQLTPKDADMLWKQIEKGRRRYELAP